MGGLYPFIVILDTIAKFNAEREIFYREMEDGLYTTGPYFFSKVLSTLPFHTTFLVLYTVPMYWLAGLQPKVRLGNFLVQTFTLVLFIVNFDTHPRCIAHVWNVFYF
jgi:ATP-binding cassette subfamily G (WHITE) protein 8 (sterolin 2)